jgi:hypothetical protein
MDQIKAKQVNGMVDQSSRQEILGEKTFKAPLIIDRLGETHHIVAIEGFLYWAQDPTRLNQDGNFRIGVVGTTLQMQSFSDGRWNNQ